ncbi:hypothetical protein EVAR_93412_1 [Eumeta japonica]|uniref:Uncharacterized protein n=1 Tax=Eumeta variegata TaxID=151549 RepID=A0A4C1UPW3_EUMVA|nr:hypothetical protein EVAR_93412_1 [Eumeta japonica]
MPQFRSSGESSPCRGGKTWYKCNAGIFVAVNFPSYELKKLNQLGRAQMCCWNPKLDEEPDCCCPSLDFSAAETSRKTYPDA